MNAIRYQSILLVLRDQTSIQTAVKIKPSLEIIDEMKITPGNKEKIPMSHGRGKARYKKTAPIMNTATENNRQIRGEPREKTAARA
jgi:hypothetical protein